MAVGEWVGVLAIWGLTLGIRVPRGDIDTGSLLSIVLHDRCIEHLHFILGPLAVCSNHGLVDGHHAAGKGSLRRPASSIESAPRGETTRPTGTRKGLRDGRDWAGVHIKSRLDRLQHLHLQRVIGRMNCLTQSSSDEEKKAEQNGNEDDVGTNDATNLDCKQRFV